MFGIDPVEVLDEPDRFRQQIREAAVLVWGEDQADMQRAMWESEP